MTETQIQNTATETELPKSSSITLTEREQDAIEYAVKNDWELGTILNALL